MKTTLLSAAVFLVGMTFVHSAIALRPGQLLPVGPVEPAYGTFEAKVKRLDPHLGPDGRYYTWSYHTISANMMMYCESQLQSWLSGSNVVVVEYCHQMN